MPRLRVPLPPLNPIFPEGVYRELELKTLVYMAVSKLRANPETPMVPRSQQIMVESGPCGLEMHYQALLEQELAKMTRG